MSQKQHWSKRPTRAERLAEIAEEIERGELTVRRADELTDEERERYGLTKRGDDG